VSGAGILKQRLPPCLLLNSNENLSYLRDGTIWS
jgi:hypothetical protein